ncbi:hypothetical protein ACFRMQ_36870 [Kitasatospora sp. NPDC056783]|uniref:hypothetical protein n=1 Tax=Kitasatospora sp. NPDC056783 TaxID=3345943 RepID=UPI0036A59446
MTTKPRQKTTPKRPISITAVVDCVGMLAAQSTQGHLYLYDTNRSGGSTGFGTEELSTPVKAGDQLLWNVLALECEAFVAIDGIEIDQEVCEPVRKVYPGTDVAYWTGTVKKDQTAPVSYRISFRLGTQAEPITTAVSPTLVGHTTGQL